jgi:hypothetical protein
LFADSKVNRRNIVGVAQATDIAEGVMLHKFGRCCATAGGACSGSGAGATNT